MTIYNIPLTKVNDPVFRSLLSCSGTKVSYPTLVNTMLELSLIVEEKIAAEMKGKRGIIMHDGWSKFSRHYVCLLVAYMASTGKRGINGEEVTKPVMTLLTCTTLPHDDDGNCEESDGTAVAHATATTFNAEAHINLFKTTFKNLKIKLSDFAIGQIADSTALNPKIARLLDIAHSACRNHCLNLGCKDMENNCDALKRLTKMTQEIHRKIKASNKLSASLENIQASCRALDDTENVAGANCKLKLAAPTRWNSITTMLSGHEKNEASLRRLISENPNRDLDDTTISRTFLQEIRSHLPYLDYIKLASAAMQARLATLEECQSLNDSIVQLQEVGSGAVAHDFKLCE